MWGDNKKKQQPEAAKPAEKEQASWNDQLKDALPQRANFFDSMRTDAFQNLNLIENYVEFWTAFKVDGPADKWRVMHYMVYDLDKPDGKFVSEPVVKDRETGKPKDVSFPEAVFQLSRIEFVASKTATTPVVDLEGQYPADQYPELKPHFYDMEHYKGVANIEGIAFNEFNQPYRRIEGKVFADATFQREEIKKTILAAEQAREHPKVKQQIEGGILGDLFNTASNRAASLDNILKIGQVLVTMDQFATQVGALYLAAQTAVGQDEGFDKITGLKDAEKKTILSAARNQMPSMDSDDACDRALRYIIPSMKETLAEARELGVHVEPFQKFTSECELYMNLLNASQSLSRLERGFVSASNSDTSLITTIRQSVDMAQKSFVELGGTQEQMDKLKAWVANPSKDSIPGWMPGFLNRYYESRGSVMQKVQQRKAGPTQVKVLPAAVKPPISDEYNDGNLQSQKPANANKPKPPGQGG